MSKVFNMVGGGGKNISSIIIIGLQSTDIVTCTKDGKSYTATWDSTDQYWEIVGLPLGTFTVTATNGAKIATETVLIDIAGVYEIEMAYKLWLYKDGDECEAITGGWSSPTIVTSAGGLNTYVFDCTNPHVNTIRTKNTDNLYLKAASPTVTNYGIAAASFWAKNGIDLTDFSTLHIKANVISPNPVIRIYTVNPLKQTVNVQNADMAANFVFTNIGEQEGSCDISNLTGTFYIGATVASYDDAHVWNKEMKVYRIWLE